MMDVYKNGKSALIVPARPKLLLVVRAILVALMITMLAGKLGSLSSHTGFFGAMLNQSYATIGILLVGLVLDVYTSGKMPKFPKKMRVR